MKPLPTVAVYGLVPVPPMPDTQATNAQDSQPLSADDVHVASLVVMWMELREMAFIGIGLSILSVGAAVALAFAL